MNQSKRDFLFFLGSIITSSFLPLKLFSQKIRPFIKINKKNPITPPGSLSQKHFTQNCIACYSCVSACPTRVIVPALFKYGSSNILQPTLDYTNRFCQYDCTICSHVCPTEAIKPITITTKKQTQVGYVNLIKQNCIVFANNTDCGACAEHCPTTAVYMVPYKNLRAPAIQPKICIGCGACESICPAKPYKAIFVEGNEVHRIASKPKRKRIRQRKGTEFPF